MSLKEYIKLRTLLESLSQPLENYINEDNGNVFSFDVRFLDSFNQAPLIYNEYLYESLLNTYRLDKFLNKLHDIFPIYSSGFLNDNFTLYITTNEKFNENDEKLKSLCNLHNVFVSKVEWKGKHLCNVLFEAKLPKKVTDEILEEPYLLHITNKKVVDKILKYGLQPKSHSKKTYHPERVYLLRSDILPEIKSYMKMLDGDTVLKIDINKLKRYNQKYEFYQDPMSPIGKAVFCENTIYPEVISELKL